MIVIKEYILSIDCIKYIHPTEYFIFSNNKDYAIQIVFKDKEEKTVFFDTEEERDIEFQKIKDGLVEKVD